ncbi:MAG: hypothetical protein M0042_14620 [Nitrospiraceae bacterium]|nr:hypothetical protein [Nitrospiraceae bacterium]
MFPTDIKTWFLYILLTVLLGALGSGFWETAFKPILSKIGRVLLRILTLGMTSAVNSMYRDIARRHVHRPILFIVMLITLISSGVLGIATSEYYVKSLGGEDQIRTDIQSTLKDKGLSGLDLEVKKREAKLSFLSFLLAIFLFVITQYSYLRNSYVISAIAYFDQCLMICLPHLTDDVRKNLMSKFAQIQTKAHYSEIIKQLEEVANQHSLTLPFFALI